MRVEFWQTNKIKLGGLVFMKENKYDDSGFFTNYSQIPRSIGGLDAAGEWAAFRSLLPDFAIKRYLILAAALAGIADMYANGRPGRWWV
jgi:hypothetical protein